MDHRKKVPRNKVLLHFYAGSCESKNILFMVYETISNNNPASDMLDLLEPTVGKLILDSSSLPKTSLVRSLHERTMKFNIIPYKLKLSKRQNGINLFESKCDEL